MHFCIKSSRPYHTESMAWQNPELHEAVIFNRVDEMVRLIKAGKDVNQVDSTQRTPLDYCLSITPSTVITTADNQRLEKAAILLSNGADPNITDRSGWTILHQCAWNGDLALTKLVVQKGGKVNLMNNDQRLPIDLASLKGHSSVVRYLETQSCDLRCTCRKVIREAMGTRCHRRICDLPLPPTMRLFINYGIPHYGWKAVLIPPAPWITEELYGGQATASDLRAFILVNASSEFIEEHKEALEPPGWRRESTEKDLENLIDAFQTMYVWEAFDREVEFEDQTARKPRYSMERLKKKGEIVEENCPENGICSTS